MATAAAAASTALPPGTHQVSECPRHPSAKTLRLAAAAALAKSEEGGEADLTCTLAADGLLQDCKAAYEDPPGDGFGAAALSVADQIACKISSKTPAGSKYSVRLSFNDFDTAPDWLKRPTIEGIEAVMPANGSDGQAIISCVVTVQGALRDCRVQEETPARGGYGGAALLLVPSLLMKPATKDGQPVEFRVEIPINFHGEGGNGPTYRMVTNLPWDKAPTSGDMAKAYPSGALAKGIAGHVAVRCSLADDGRLRECQTITEKPDGYGFGRAAESLTRLFRAPLGESGHKLVSNVRINLPVQFDPPAPNAPTRYLSKTEWTRALKPDAVLEAFPGKAADAGLVTGRVMLDCAVAEGGGLGPCIALTEDPPGMDFGPAAMSIAPALAVNPWTDDGLPAEGAHLRFAIRFVRQEPAPAAPPAH